MYYLPFFGVGFLCGSYGLQQFRGEKMTNTIKINNVEADIYYCPICETVSDSEICYCNKLNTG